MKTYNSTQLTLKGFPNDDQLRIIWAYGGIKRTSSGDLVVQVMLREANNNLMPSYVEDALLLDIPFPQLDIVRLMDIWQGNKKINKQCNQLNYVKRLNNQQFTLYTNNAASIPFGAKNDSNALCQTIPQNIYGINRINNTTEYYGLIKTKFTILKDTANNKNIVIPALELFTSTYVPQEQTIRTKLVLNSIDTVLDDYIESAHINGDTYNLYLKSNKEHSNIAFLAYARLNNTTKQRLSVLRNSFIQNHDNGQYIYPNILPYHPNLMDIQGDGFWLNENTFLMFKITGYSLPEDFKIVHSHEKIKTKMNSSNSHSPHKQYTEHILIETKNPLITDLSPLNSNPTIYIRSEVSILNSDAAQITKTEHEKHIEHNSYKENDIDRQQNELNSISSSYKTSSRESKNIGGIKIVSPHDQINKNNHLQNVINALNELKNNKTAIGIGCESYIENIEFMNNNLYFSETATTISFKYIIKIATDKIINKKSSIKYSSWLSLNAIKDKKVVSLENRSFLLVKIILSNGKSGYLFEIAKKQNEGFMGLLSDNKIIQNKNYFLSLIIEIIKNDGKLSKIKIQNTEYLLFKHSIGKNMVFSDCILNALRRAVDQNIFT